jgi:hypothetical protein
MENTIENTALLLGVVLMLVGICGFSIIATDLIL